MYWNAEMRGFARVESGFSYRRGTNFSATRLIHATHGANHRQESS
jgi:hypothetical protein